MNSSEEILEKISPGQIRSALLADTCFGRVSVGLVSGGKFAGELSAEGGAMENFFPLLSELSEKSSVRLSSIEAFGLCDGVGSVLGIRVSSAALSTMALACGGRKTLFTWNLFDAARANADELCKSGGDYAVAAPSRKNFINAIWREGGVRGEAELECGAFAERFSAGKARLFYINQRPVSDGRLSFLETAETMRLSLEDVWKYACEGLVEMRRRSIPPDALLLSKREYVKWNSQARI